MSKDSQTYMPTESKLSLAQIYGMVSASGYAGYYFLIKIQIQSHNCIANYFQ
jgi:hypothetical protein